MQYTDIRFPNLGIVFSHVGRYISIGDFPIMFYGIIIAAGFLAGLFIAQKEAKRTGQNPEIYMDYLICMMIPAIIGARAYYVIFSWDYYSKNPLEIINLRHGGLGIVGGVAAAIVVLLIFAKVRGQKAALMLDTMTMSLLVGQIMGRWGNFFNREAFGGYTDSLLAMQIPVGYFAQNGRLAEIQNAGLMDHLVNLDVGGQTISYIQVHPTFLYEGLWNCLVLLVIFLYRKHKKFDGELLCIYLMGYGIGRFFIEGLRVDQLQIGDTGIAATQVVCILVFVGSLVAMLIRRRKAAASC
ncbi:MAG TPA: prolipoprotein diacylglyceryl transferase [Candidatus Anaerobutyricum stercoripullorum]|uniref:Phosphatidylglycerol--prolipoprotein diacylglyceryl transferase n=1 Tax=Candidatus Anaerobutyricum stercoripullorum TaxID=2838456 RepID=A0A9D2BDR3_9FIRM|nr:prolipoprotein diacylglyceryl transferase [Candidatus Anaerobutyricum stercoripullorum]